MEDDKNFLWDSKEAEEYGIKSDEKVKQDVEDIFNELHGISVDELEIELRRKEKELYLCSTLGLFLAQEVDELICQKRGILSDHTKLLLELQEFKTSQNTFNSSLPPGSEAPSSSGSSKYVSPRFDGAKLDDLQTSMPRINSVESLDLLSNPDSINTMSSSATHDLHTDLNLVQRAHERITSLEMHLDKARAKYRRIMTDYSHKLKDLSRQLGTCVSKSRPYFDAVQKAKKWKMATQQAVMEYKKAVNRHKVARDMVKVAEERVMKADDKLDLSWQEMLNQANLKVTEASEEKNRVHKIHLKAASEYKGAEDNKCTLETKLHRHIEKSKPYFEVQKEFQKKLESITKKLNTLDLKLLEARHNYSVMLKRLQKSNPNNPEANKEKTEEETLKERGSGVGAEHPLGIESTYGATLAKPALDFLEKAMIDKAPDGESYTPETTDSYLELAKNKLKLSYNPYDLTYLSNQIESIDDSSDSDSGDEYIQDF